MPKGVYHHTYDFECVVCNANFISQRKISKFCSNTCRNIVWRNSNRDKYREKQSTWIKNNPERHIVNQSSYKKNRKKNDIEYRLRCIIRSRLGRIRRNHSMRTIEWLGCSIAELKLHLESKFLPGMDWDNHGLYGWHIDHIIPISNFDVTNSEEFKKACHYTNLQPLWAKDNLVKSNKI
jgi:hypothetical protein